MAILGGGVVFGELNGRRRVRPGLFFETWRGVLGGSVRRGSARRKGEHPDDAGEREAKREQRPPRITVARDGEGRGGRAGEDEPGRERDEVEGGHEANTLNIRVTTPPSTMVATPIPTAM